jgi:hypothetical protein
VGEAWELWGMDEVLEVEEVRGRGETQEKDFLCNW